MDNYTNLTKQEHYLTTESIDYKSANVFIVQGPGVKGLKASPQSGVPYRCPIGRLVYKWDKYSIFNQISIMHKKFNIDQSQGASATYSTPLYLT